LIENARAVRGYLAGVTRKRWDAEDILRDAVLYRMLLLGEIASALPDELRDRYPDVAWRPRSRYRGRARSRSARIPSEEKQPQRLGLLRRNSRRKSGITPAGCCSAPVASGCWNGRGHAEPAAEPPESGT
jgi:hypothetical protein